MAAFGTVLPALRRRLRADLARPDMSRSKVLAVVVSLLDATLARIGNDEYVRANGSYGLTTLRSNHVRFVRDGSLRFRFRGKGGVGHEIAIDDKRVARIVRRCHQLPGQRLFQYVDETGELRPVDSGQVNDYLRAASGADFTAKDFRTWGATVRAVELLAQTPIATAPSESAAKSRITAVVRRVAEELRNTPAVCRKSYINPAVVQAWRDGLFDTRGKVSARSAGALTVSLLRVAARRAARSDRSRTSYARIGDRPISRIARVPDRSLHSASTV